MSAGFWTDERIEQLTTLWGQGWSASQISQLFGGEVSRSAVCAKVNRLGIHGGSQKRGGGRASAERAPRKRVAVPPPPEPEPGPASRGRLSRHHDDADGLHLQMAAGRSLRACFSLLRCEAARGLALLRLPPSRRVRCIAQASRWPARRRSAFEGGGMTRDLGPSLADVCPEYAAALDAFEAEPTQERWDAVTASAQAFWAQQKNGRRVA